MSLVQNRTEDIQLVFKRHKLIVMAKLDREEMTKSDRDD